MVVDVEETKKQYLVTAGYDGLVAFWHPKKAPEMGPNAGDPDRWELRCHHKFRSSVLDLAVCSTPLSTILASGGVSQHLTIWDMRRLEVRSEHKRHNAITCVCASDAGRRVFNGCKGGFVTGLEVLAGHQTDYSGHTSSIFSIACHGGTHGYPVTVYAGAEDGKKQL